VMVGTTRVVLTRHLGSGEGIGYVIHADPRSLCTRRREMSAIRGEHIPDVTA
jgi:hypothetical protein